MLLQTNSYIVPKDKRAEHARLLQRFRQTLARLGCEHFESYEQVGANWSGNETTGRFVQLMRFRDRKQQQKVQAAERNDPQAQALIKEFCELINFPYQQQQGLFVVGFYQGVVSLNSPVRQPPTLGEPANANGTPPSLSGEPGSAANDDTAAGDVDALALDELESSAGDDSADESADEPTAEQSPDHTADVGGRDDASHTNETH